jgi:hypothetical protein
MIIFLKAYAGGSILSDSMISGPDYSERTSSGRAEQVAQFIKREADDLSIAFKASPIYFLTYSRVTECHICVFLKSQAMHSILHCQQVV